MEKISLKAAEKELLLLCELLNQLRLLALKKKPNSESVQKKTYAKYLFLIKRMATALENKKHLEQLQPILDESLSTKKTQLDHDVIQSIKKKIYKDLELRINKVSEKQTELIKEDEGKKLNNQESVEQYKKPALPNIEEESIQDEVEINLGKNKEEEWSKQDLVDFVKNNPNNKPRRIIEEKAKSDLQLYIAKLRKYTPSKLEKLVLSFLPKKKF